MPVSKDNKSNGRMFAASYKAVEVYRDRNNGFGNNNSTPAAHQNGGNEGLPARYSSKFMDSIWGEYNRYAPHAFQKNFESFQRHTLAAVGSSNVSNGDTWMNRCRS